MRNVSFGNLFKNFSLMKKEYTLVYFKKKVLIMKIMYFKRILKSVNL